MGRGEDGEGTNMGRERRWGGRGDGEKAKMGRGGDGRWSRKSLASLNQQIFDKNIVPQQLSHCFLLT